MPGASQTYTDHKANFGNWNKEIPAVIGRSSFTRTVLTCCHRQIRLNTFNNMIISTACGVWLTRTFLIYHLEIRLIILRNRAKNKYHIPRPSGDGNCVDIPKTPRSPVCVTGIASGTRREAEASAVFVHYCMFLSTVLRSHSWNVKFGVLLFHWIRSSK